MRQHNKLTNKWPGIGQNSVCQLISCSLCVGNQEPGKGWQNHYKRRNRSGFHSRTYPKSSMEKCLIDHEWYEGAKETGNTTKGSIPLVWSTGGQTKEMHAWALETNPL